MLKDSPSCRFERPNSGGQPEPDVSFCMQDIFKRVLGIFLEQIKKISLELKQTK
jgi:hypothetical protein